MPQAHGIGYRNTTGTGYGNTADTGLRETNKDIPSKLIGDRTQMGGGLEAVYPTLLTLFTGNLVTHQNGHRETVRMTLLWYLFRLGFY